MLESGVECDEFLVPFSVGLVEFGFRGIISRFALRSEEILGVGHGAVVGNACLLVLLFPFFHSLVIRSLLFGREIFLCRRRNGAIAGKFGHGDIVGIYLIHRRKRVGPFTVFVGVDDRVDNLA